MTCDALDYKPPKPEEVIDHIKQEIKNLENEIETRKERIREITYYKITKAKQNEIHDYFLSA